MTLMKRKGVKYEVKEKNHQFLHGTLPYFICCTGKCIGGIRIGDAKESGQHSRLLCLCGASTDTMEGK